MPIYAYRCDSCGHAQDVLQRLSDPILSDCPSCGAATFRKQVTAAGFQLKGSGWYATDFRNNGSAPGATVPPVDGAKPAVAAPAAATPAPASAPAPAVAPSPAAGSTS
jgi:putative FmdB family regulatory protein